MANKQSTGAEFFQGGNGEWFWRIRAPNGNVVGGSAEGYRRISGAKKGFDALRVAILSLDQVEPAKAPRKPRAPKAAPVEAHPVEAQPDDGELPWGN